MFLINSCQNRFAATLLQGRPFFRSYGASLPSSLERVLSRPLVFSTNLPVSVSGTGNFCVFRRLLLEVYELFLEVEHHWRLSRQVSKAGSRLSSRFVFFRPFVALNASTAIHKQTQFSFLRPSNPQKFVQEY